MGWIANELESGQRFSTRLSPRLSAAGSRDNSYVQSSISLHGDSDQFQTLAATARVIVIVIVIFADQ
jgi:hypothetical protein